MKKIDCILLVDDDSTTNFLNSELISDLNICNQVHVAHNGQEALNYIKLEGEYKGVDKKLNIRPNLIFLDINMPLMDGFEFLKEYKLLPKSKRANCMIVFLTTSDAVKDKIKSEANELIYEFIEKPLRKDDLLAIVEEYFRKKIQT